MPECLSLSLENWPINEKIGRLFVNEKPKKIHKIRRIGILMTRNLVVTWTVLLFFFICGFWEENGNNFFFYHRESLAYFFNSFSFRLNFNSRLSLLKQFLFSIVIVCDCELLLWVSRVCWFYDKFSVSIYDCVWFCLCAVFLSW